MRAMDKTIGMLHFTGIGGIGMSGIAEILLSLGYQVQGSDLAENANVLRLRGQGVDIRIGHHADHVQGVAAVIVSSAIKADNPEVIAARQAGIPIVRRAEMLAELMRLKAAIAVGGTHGKTTTTAMIGRMLEIAAFDPTVINGGIVNAYGSNTRLGQSDIMVVEADESDGTFTRLPASVTVVTNIDAEHMDHYASFDEVRSAYRSFVENIPFYGYGVLCIDHPEVQALIAQITDRRIITYGFSPQADVQASRLRHSPEGVTFDVEFSAWLAPQQGEQKLLDMHMPMLGTHNVQNALVALAIAQQMGVTHEVMRAALLQFTGVKRRFTQTGDIAGITIIDDYAHHPVEIATVLKTARSVCAETGGRVIAVMQPHRYTRLSSLFEEFCTCFNEADSVIVAPVYSAGETLIEGATHETLAEGIIAHGHRHVLQLDKQDDLAPLIADLAQSGDYVICMGAGDITAWAQSLPKQLDAVLKSKAA